MSDTEKLPTSTRQDALPEMPETLEDFAIFLGKARELLTLLSPNTTGGEGPTSRMSFEEKVQLSSQILDRVVEVFLGMLKKYPGSVVMDDAVDPRVAFDHSTATDVFNREFVVHVESIWPSGLTMTKFYAVILNRLSTSRM